MYRDITRRPTEQDPLEAGVLAVANELRGSMTHFVETSVRYTMDIAIGANMARMQRDLESARPRLFSKVIRGSDGDDHTGDPHEPVDPTDRHTPTLLEEQAAQPTWTSSSSVHAPPVHPGLSVQQLLDTHHRSLDTITRSCLLGDDALSEAAYDSLMRLLSLVLDAGKVVRSAVRGWTPADISLDSLRDLQTEWKEAESRFVRSQALIPLKSLDGYSLMATKYCIADP